MEVIHDREGAQSPSRTEGGTRLVALEEGSVEPKPREPLRCRPLRVEVNTGMGSRAACRRLGTQSLGL